jgi:hypothetical protein
MMKRGGFFALSLLAGCSSATPSPEDTAAADVQLSSSRNYVVATSLDSVLAGAQRATGALLVPRLNASGKRVTASDGTPIRSSCGVTFIDRTHAITAAHCADEVDVPDPKATALTVQFIDVDASADYKSAARLSGKFPRYAHKTIDSGYTTTETSCHIIHRCKFGPYACPPGATADDADIMMLSCSPGLPADREPVAVAAHDTEKGAARVFWFHEIYEAPTSRPPASDTTGTDLFLHYTTADESGQQNLHYFEGRNQLLPLVSAEWSAGIPRTRLRREGTTVWTDLFGCHGTSGSGVMALSPTSGKYELLGPVATASADWGSARLCTDLSTHRRGRASTSYTANDYTRELASLL